MNVTQWIIFILVIQVIHFLGTWKLYVKAGRQAWEAAVPIYNAIVLMKIINRPTWWTVLLFVPIINLLMFPIIWIETIRSFGRNSLKETWLVLLTLGFYIYYVNYSLDVKYIEDRSLFPKTATGEWVSSIAFAVIAATLVHTYFIQPYVIPTPSLERTLRVGDLLFVSKFHYGARTPMTTVAAPMVHDTLPVLGVKSYLSKPQLPYFRLPGFSKVDRNDIVVFSWPADTVRQFYKREQGVDKPIDKKSNYVKRCVAIPGDSLEIRNGFVYINGEQLKLNDRAKPMFQRVVTVKNDISSYVNLFGKENFKGRIIKMPLNILEKERATEILDAVDLNEVKRDSDYVYYAGYLSNQKVVDFLQVTSVPNMGLFNMSEDEKKSFDGKDGVISIEQFTESNPNSRVFPQNKNLSATIDNFGPIFIPAKGATVPLNLKTLPYYKKIIKDYEHNTLGVAGNQITINGEVADNYTFQQDYYWMMGDNRHSSEDSRFWGYVPENHIVGTPIFIWMSVDNFNQGILNWKPRWDRIFTTVNGDGEPVSYFKYFLIALVLYFVGSWLWKKKQSKK